MLLSVRSDLISDAAQTLSRLAKILSENGDADRAEDLLRTAADLELSSPELQRCWGGPFNGQIGRQALFVDLLDLIKPSAIIETGTFRGISTEWLSQNFAGTIYTCEKERLYHLQEEARFQKIPNIRLFLDDSRSFLESLLPTLSTDQALIIYLDAHWDADLPLCEELRIIFASEHRAVVIIDDFHVPDDLGYQWDDYPEGPLDVNTIASALPSDAQVFFPLLPSEKETGARRGCCVIPTRNEPRVAQSALLRGKPISEWALYRDAATGRANAFEPTRNGEHANAANEQNGASAVGSRLYSSEGQHASKDPQLMTGGTTHLQVCQTESEREALKIEVASIQSGPPFARPAQGTANTKKTRRTLRYKLAKELKKFGRKFARFIENVSKTDEARLVSELSDGEFAIGVAELFSESIGVNPRQIEAHKRFLREDQLRRSGCIKQLVAEYFGRLQKQDPHRHDPDNCWIMGTNNYLNRKSWDERATELSNTRRAKMPKQLLTLAEREFHHSGDYVVSAIASLYKGRRYLEAFLENITSQTFFDRSELIIIDANSREDETILISAYQKKYPNIVYLRMNYRIGIYDAWNEGVRLARGRYLTNVNLDDLRRSDSFEIQAAALDEHRFADVVYQDFFYSFDPTLSFEEVAEFDFKSNLPIVTANNQLCFNSPHNAPMWRAQLHEELGLFDTSFKSAGDHEYWLRCIEHGKCFFKLNDPHVVYFQNPEGISTSPDSKGAEEGRRLISKYARRLISPYLLMSRHDFAKTLGIRPEWVGERKTSEYAAIQKELRLLNRRPSDSDSRQPSLRAADATSSGAI